MPDLTGSIQTLFASRTIAVIGDLVADQFLSGTISRVSREAPVFIMRHEDTSTLPGAGANAAANAAALGAKALMVGVIGSDENGSLLHDALSTAGVDTAGVATVPHCRTTTKVRVLAGQHLAAKQQVIRIDYEAPERFGDDVIDQLRKNVVEISCAADAIVISDYGYGVVSREIYSDALAIANERSIPIVVDSRYRLAELIGATSATPNREEVEALLGPNPSDQACEDLRRRLGNRALLVTNGSNGMSLFEDERPPNHMPAVGSPTAVDVTGAGDTVIAAYALGLAAGLGFAHAARIANHAGGIAVMKKRTATVSIDELRVSLQNDPDTASGRAA